ncbi:MAG: hypothetical protein HDR52_07055, partial [Treponema sp.]|nr:hypothetical protein [Treponema sp.]
MKKIIFILASIALFTVFFVSCGSTPEPTKAAVDSQSAQPPVEETNSEENEESVSHNPNEDATPTVDIAAENQAALEKAEAARQSAIEAGVDTLLPEKFAEIDALYETAKEKAQAGEDVSSDLDKIGKLYSALEQYSLAMEAKNRIDENNFADYNKTAYDKGCAFLSNADELLQEPLANADELLESATNANGQFKNVIFEAYKKLSKDERTKAFIEKRNADTVRAGVAAKEEYNAAVDEFRKGDAAYSMQNPESAYEHYRAAKTQFTAVYTTVSEKRANTEKAMLDAQKQVEDAYSYAQNADKNSPLEGDDIEGIEPSDAVLLEADAYEKPEALEADIPEDIDAPSEVTEEAEQNVTEPQENTTQEIEANEDVLEAEENSIENAQSEETAEHIEEVEEAETSEDSMTETDESVEAPAIDETSENTENNQLIEEKEFEEVEATSSIVEESDTETEPAEPVETEEFFETTETTEETAEPIEEVENAETSEDSMTETDENAEAPAIDETSENAE